MKSSTDDGGMTRFGGSSHGPNRVVRGFSSERRYEHNRRVDKSCLVGVTRKVLPRGEMISYSRNVARYAGI